MKKKVLGKYLGIVHRLHVLLIDKYLEPYDIRHGQLLLLLAIYNNEGITQNDLCEMYRIDKAAVSKNIKKLIDKDFLMKEVDPKDKRRQLIYVTDKGRKHEEEFRKILSIIQQDCIEGLSEKELNSFFNVTNKIIDNLSKKLKEK